MKALAQQLVNRPLTRSFLLFLAFLVITATLNMFWKTSSQKSAKVGFEGHDGGRKRQDKLVTAHFMLGNTYPYTEADWQENFQAAEETGIDAFALNLGPEDWQTEQARSAYRICAARQQEHGADSDPAFKLFLSLDMNVLPSDTRDDMDKLVQLVDELGNMDCQLTVSRAHASDAIWVEDEDGSTRKIVLSTFGGGQASFGGDGWQGFLQECKQRGLNIYFIPAFFLPPQTILDMPFVDATFDWNSGWPEGNDTISTESDQVFLHDDRPYMAAISPGFFTHYGTTGPWAWNKNWIYRSDDNLYASRWQQILDPSFDPDFVQIISWNDYGESHYIGPIMGAQPGSEAWTRNRDHTAWRILTKYLVRKFKGISDPDSENLEVWLTYRTHPKDLVIAGDPVGRPERADFAQDVVSVAILLPEKHSKSSWSIKIEAGKDDQFERKVRLDRTVQLQTFLVPFGPGDVSFKVKQDRKTVLEGKGARIENDARRILSYNFNAWTGHWTSQIR